MATWMGGTAERPARFFSGPEDFREWLHQHHATATELWMGLHKRHVPDRGLTWEDAVPEALCYGWIDSLSQRIDDDSRRQRWTPRKPTSSWSRVNLALVEQLIADGRMQPAGLEVYRNRRREPAPYSYERDGELSLPEPYEAQLRANLAAAQFFWGRATPGYRRACVQWVMSAKRETTRDSRLAALVEDSAAGRLIAPQRYGDPPAWAR